MILLELENRKWWKNVLYQAKLLRVIRRFETRHFILGLLARKMLLLESLAAFDTPNSISVIGAHPDTSSPSGNALISILKLISILIDIAGIGGSVAGITGESDSGGRLGNPEGLRLGLSLGNSLPGARDDVPAGGAILGISLGNGVIVVPADGVAVGKGVVEDVGLLVGVAVTTIVGMDVEAGASGQNSRSGGPRSL
jgi:hypothetical protein